LLIINDYILPFAVEFAPLLQVVVEFAAKHNS